MAGEANTPAVAQQRLRGMGITQGEVAATLDVDPTTMSRWMQSAELSVVQLAAIDWAVRQIVADRRRAGLSAGARLERQRGWGVEREVVTRAGREGAGVTVGSLHDGGIVLEAWGDDHNSDPAHVCEYISPGAALLIVGALIDALAHAEGAKGEVT